MTERLPVPGAHAARGAYIARVNLEEPHLAGVAQKVRAQMAALAAAPAELELLYPAGGAVMRNGEAVHRFGDGPLWRRLTYYLLFHVYLARHAQVYDFLYIRFQGSSPLFVWMLRKLKRANPRLVVLLEIPSWPYHLEKVTLRLRLLALLDKLSRSWLRPYVDRVVTFSREERIFGIETIRTDNGVDVAALARQEQQPEPTLRLLGLANLSFWHGYDRIIEGMARYYAGGGTRPVVFEVVGTGSELTRLQELARTSGLAERVRFHGPRTGTALDAIVGSCHVGISTVGMHRVQYDTSTLKSREYCARGLPFVLGYDDRDFPQGFPYALQVPASDEPIDIATLIAFHDDLVRARPQFAHEMHAYANERLTWAAKMHPVAQVLKMLIRPAAQEASWT